MRTALVQSDKDLCSVHSAQRIAEELARNIKVKSVPIVTWFDVFMNDALAV